MEAPLKAIIYTRPETKRGKPKTRGRLDFMDVGRCVSL